MRSMRYGEIVDINLVRDKATGKSKGFAFVAYEDQRSTVLAVDNFNGIKILNRNIRVDHVGKYRGPKKDDDYDSEEERQRQMKILPSHLIPKEWKKQESSSESESEDADDPIKRKLAELDPEDPMREYYAKKLAKKAKKDAKKAKKGKKEKKAKKHKRAEDVGGGGAPDIKREEDVHKGTRLYEEVKPTGIGNAGIREDICTGTGETVVENAVETAAGTGAGTGAQTAAMPVEEEAEGMIVGTDHLGGIAYEVERAAIEHGAVIVIGIVLQRGEIAVAVAVAVGTRDETIGGRIGGSM
ncbi:RNA-binding motif protein, X-linked 2 [Borealophlyctis nickersoniae]|nr:RNA-binding motif protein, X-linked 2 [Borealophlyctis nickersoniae]